MTRADDKRLKSFIEKLQEEGSSGFGAGPLPVAPGAGSQARAAAPARSGLRWMSVIRQLLTIVFVLMLATVVAFYFLHRAELDAVTMQLDSIVNAPSRSALEERLSDVENRLAERNDPYAQQLQIIERRLTDNRQMYERGFRDVEQKLVQFRQPYEGRLQDIEQRLVKLRKPDDNRLRAVEKKLQHMTSRLDEWTAVMAELAGNEKAVIAANAAMIAEPPAALPAEPVVVGRNNEALQQVRDGSPLQRRDGDWVINIASYLGEKIAARKLAYFRRQGIAAEQEVATVRGKTIYRVQVAGFDSLAAARSSARTIGDQLGIEDLWVRRH